MNMDEDYNSFYNLEDDEYYNNSTYTFDNETTLFNITSTSSNAINLPPQILASLVLYALVFLLGVPGNLLVIWITGFEMKRTVNTIWFLHLSIADLLCCLTLPFLAMQVILDQHWPLGIVICKLIPPLALLNMYMSVLLLATISADRCALVLKPVWCQNNRTVLKATAVCISLWLLALLMTTPSFFFQSIYSPPLTHKEVCTMHYAKAGNHQNTVKISVVTYRFVLGFVVPFFMITICYGLLISKVKSSRFSQSSKTLKIVLTVIIGFFVCWFPYHVTAIILASQPPTSNLFLSTHRADPIVVSLAYINSCINPIIYVLMGQDFKQKFKKNIKSILKNVLTDDTSQFTSESRKTRSTLEERHTDTKV
ncbi:C5a anaphylatoxin chemotactic receptor 1 [Microcaecilia unicolor]|uniref:C5a anaphylatoxin chemotactic receptor 1 n=1 Tax=Microcaecilia unicolor TaxID=1415580 RepID=A0A6P7ZG15_9AMPH|nr:C5a anaphylatoxin chemotactic receptor 1 [Microcaecilia unicolor]